MSTDTKMSEVQILDESNKRVSNVLDGLSNLATGLGTAKDKASRYC